MLRNVATAAIRYATDHRHETAARIAASPKNGNRYRSWTRVGAAKNASASTLTPTRIVSRSGLRATAHATSAAVPRSRIAPSAPAGIGPMAPQDVASGIAESGIHSAPPAMAALWPSTGNSAHQL